MSPRRRFPAGRRYVRRLEIRIRARRYLAKTAKGARWVPRISTLGAPFRRNADAPLGPSVENEFPENRIGNGTTNIIGTLCVSNLATCSEPFQFSNGHRARGDGRLRLYRDFSTKITERRILRLIRLTFDRRRSCVCVLQICNIYHSPPTPLALEIFRHSYMAF